MSPPTEITLEFIKRTKSFRRYDDLAKRLWGKRESKEVMETVFRTWDVSVPNLDTLSSGEEVSQKFTSFNIDPDEPQSLSSPWLVREEYRVLADFVPTEASNRRPGRLSKGGIALLGNPGIGQSCIIVDGLTARTLTQLILTPGLDVTGKSIFLMYFLVEYLLDAKPILLYDPHFPDIVVAFSGPGADPVSVREVECLEPALSTGILLMDSATTLKIAPEVLWDKYSELFIVHATSPGPALWQRWLHLRQGRMFWMECWSWEEIYTYGCCMNSLDVIKVREAFLKYGPIPRDVVMAVRGDEQAKFLDYLLQKAASDAAKAYPTHMLPTYFQKHLRGASKDTSRIFLRQPELITRYQTTFDFVSLHARNHFCSKLESARKLQEFYQVVSGNPRSSALAEWIWKYRFETWLKHGLQPIEMKPLRTQTLQSTSAIPIRLSRPPQYDWIDFSMMDSTVAAGLEQGPVVLAPRSRSYPTWDSAAVFDGRITLFQITRADHHNIKPEGLESLLNALPASSPYRPSAASPWRLVFVVPNEVAGAWNKAQPISGEARTKWEPLIEQYIARCGWWDLC